MSTQEQDISLEQLMYLADSESNDADTQPTTPDVDPFDDGIDGDELAGISDQEDPSQDEVDEDGSDDDTSELDVEFVDPDTTEDSEDSEEPEDSKNKGDGKVEEFYNFLSSSGYLQVDEDFEFTGDEESMEKALDQTVKKLQDQAATQLWQSFPQDFQEVAQFVANGGRSVKEFLSLSQQQLDFDNIELDSADTQKQLLHNYYSETTKLAPEKINNLIKRAELAGTLESDAAEAYDELKALIDERKATIAEQDRKYQENLEKQQEEQRRAINESVDTSEFIGDKRKGKVKAFLMNPIKKGEQVDTDFNRALFAISSNPEHLVQLADILMDYAPDKGFAMDRFEARASSKATRSLKKRLEEATQAKGKVSGKGSKSVTKIFD
jgi:hypothetical protein